jgi:hypothetical protein
VLNVEVLYRGKGRQRGVTDLGDRRKLQIWMRTKAPGPKAYSSNRRSCSRTGARTGERTRSDSSKPLCELPRDRLRAFGIGRDEVGCGKPASSFGDLSKLESISSAFSSRHAEGRWRRTMPPLVGKRNSKIQYSLSAQTCHVAHTNEGSGP